MPRPRSLKNVTSARPNQLDGQLLTPRTPRFRSGREFELQDSGEDDDWRRGRQYIFPLLSSSASESFSAEQATGDWSRGDDYNSNGTRRDKEREEKEKLQMSTFFANFPLALGILFACFLLFLAYLSYYRSERLYSYFGIPPGNSTNSTLNLKTLHHNASTNPTNPDLLISYENYTTFPLKPAEYLIECARLNKGYMSHGDYWQPHRMGVLDTFHPDREGSKEVCTSTITYMLDGKVGLLADLALLAQVAALARQVTIFFLRPLPCN